MREKVDVIILLLRSILVFSYLLPRSEETNHLGYRKTQIERPRVINGIPVDEDVYPFVVSITRFDAINNRYELLGTGTIVTVDKVLTACQCVGKVVGKKVELYLAHWIIVSAGTLKLFDTSSITKQESVGKRTIHHPSCKATRTNETQYDCAAIELLVPFKINDHVKPVEWYSYSKIELVAQLELMVSQRSICSVPGWGSTMDAKYTPSHRLLETKVRLVSLEFCGNALCRVDHTFCDHKLQTDSQVCTMPYVSSPCLGDPGSPLVCNGFVYAQMSWSVGCRPTYPTVFVHPEVMLYMIDYKPEAPNIVRIRESVARATKMYERLVLLTVITVIVHIYMSLPM